MAKNFLVDTDVLIEHLKGNLTVSKFLEKLRDKGELCVSVLSQAEVYAGMREEEREITELLFDTLKSFDVNHEIAKLGGAYRRTYKDSHGTGLMDGMIGATAEIYGLVLVTSNKSHFPIPKLKLLSPK